jgi:hypothetical protein
MSAYCTLSQVRAYSYVQRTLPEPGGNEAGLGIDLGMNDGCCPAKFGECPCHYKDDNLADLASHT